MYLLGWIGLVGGTPDQVALPVTRHHPIRHLWRPQVDADHLGNPAAPIFARRARLAAAFALTKTRDQVLAQLPLGVRVDGGVDGLVRDVQFRFVGPHDAQCLRDLLRRPQPAQHVRDQGPHRPIGIKLRGWPGLGASCVASRSRVTANVGSTTAIARQLATERRWAAPQSRGDAPQGQPLEFHRRQRHALFGSHLLESSSHRHTLPEGQGVALQI